MKSSYRSLLVLAWLVIVFGYLWLLSFAYEKDKGFVLFVFLAVSGNLAYDGLKLVLRYDPMYITDAKTVLRYVAGFVACLLASGAFLVVGALLYLNQCLSELAAQTVSGIGFLACITAGASLLGNAEKTFRNTSHG